MKNFFNKLNKQLNIRNAYFLALLLVTLILVIGSFSYALFTSYNIKNNAVSITTGDLITSIESNELDSNKEITVLAQSTSIFKIVLSNPNLVNAKFNLYYSSNSDLTNVEIGYYDTGDDSPPKEGIILSKSGEDNSSKTIVVQIKNNSLVNVTIQFGSNVGLSNKALAFPDNTNNLIKVDNKIVCKRATTLHTEECTQTDSSLYCSGAGYTTTGSKGTTTITYGNLGTNGTLTSGDAFDCDVNGDGTYDSESERFYYLTDENEETASMVFYNNTVAGQPSIELATAYDENNDAYTNGPATAINQLPTTTQWKNITLLSTTRNILDELEMIRKENFNYQNYAARMLSVKEINSACNITVGASLRGELDSCNYLMENTTYSNVKVFMGYWLETVYSISSNKAWRIYGSYRNVYWHTIDENIHFGVRPVIELTKDKIAY